MAKKVKITKGGQTVYPATVMDAVVHPGLRVDSSKLIEEVNVSKIYPTGGIDGTNKYTLETAIAKIPASLRSVGIKCSFLNEDGTLETWEYQGGTWTNTGSWKQQSSGGNKILEWNTDVATTRKQVATNERKPGMQISYKNAEGEWVNEQYVGTLLTDAEWSKDSNWEQIPNQKYLSDLETSISFINSVEIYREENQAHSGSTKIKRNFFKGKTYAIQASVDLGNFRIGDNINVPLTAGKVSNVSLEEDCSYFYYASYAPFEYLIINQINTLKETTVNASEISHNNDKLINGTEAIIFNRNPIEIYPENIGAPVSFSLIGSGDSASVIKVDEGDAFIITATKYNDVYRPYAFIDEKSLIIEGAYAMGMLDNETVIAPARSAYLVLNNNKSTFSAIPVNKGVKPDIDILKAAVVTNSNKIACHDSLLYNTVHYYNETVNAQGSTTINVTLLKGQSYYVLSSGDMSNFTLGNRVAGENLGTISANVNTIITPKENIGIVYFEAYNKALKIDIYQTIDIQEQMEKINSFISLRTKYPSYSILGDSYSTYEGYLVPEINDAYYPVDTINDVEKTWWGLLAKEQGMMLMQNNSYSGTCVCNSDRVSSILQQNSFIRRMSNLERASVIFLFGGTNDSWNNVDLGEFKYSDWTDEELKTFRPAFSYMLDFIKKKHFGSKIVVIKNPPVPDGTGFTEEISASIDEICLHYSIDTLSPSISKASNWHPNEAGMRSIYDTIVDYLLHN